jgi:TolB-like protein/class 3 adenylate cyclase/tetratricopeptide (TPR) repeat protein
MNEPKVERRLAAILAADVVSYSRMIEADETGTVQRLKELRDDFFDPLIARRQGRIDRLAGDGALIEFPSVVEAVQCAIDLQRGMLRRNAPLPEHQRIVFRVGVNLGDIVVEDDNLHGDGINVAARLESLADPGTILVTEQVAQNVFGKVDAALTFVEERTLKNIERPVRIHRVLLDGDAQGSETDGGRKKISRAAQALAAAGALLGIALAITFWWPWETSPGRLAASDGASTKPPSTASRVRLSDKPSIAVLPFLNMSGDPDQEYFADGMTDDLITDLSKISGLLVIARNSSFIYKERNVEATEIANELGVTHILRGSVRRSGGQVRINVQLVDAARGGHAWAERYDGSLHDVFALQDTINREIVTRLAVRLTGEDVQRLERSESVDVEAYDVWLRGHELFSRFNPADNVEAREFFKRAILLDNRYARALASLAASYSAEVNFNWASNPKESVRLGLEYAARAASIDENIPQIHFARTVLYLANREHDAAIEAAKRSIETDPNYADGHAGLAFVYSWAGRPEQALDYIYRATRLNPQSSFIYLAIEGHALFQLGRYRDALKAYERVLERNPGFDRGYLMRAATHAMLDELDEAEWALSEALAIRPEITLASERIGALYRYDADRSRYIEALRKAGMAE